MEEHISIHILILLSKILNGPKQNGSTKN